MAPLYTDTENIPPALLTITGTVHDSGIFECTQNRHLISAYYRERFITPYEVILEDWDKRSIGINSGTTPLTILIQVKNHVGPDHVTGHRELPELGLQSRRLISLFH